MCIDSSTMHNDNFPDTEYMFFTWFDYNIFHLTKKNNKCFSQSNDDDNIFKLCYICIEHLITFVWSWQEAKIVSVQQ